MANDFEGCGGEGAKRLELDGVVKNVEDMRVVAEEGGRATVEVEPLGETM